MADSQVQHSFMVLIINTVNWLVRYLVNQTVFEPSNSIPRFQKLFIQDLKIRLNITIPSTPRLLLQCHFRFPDKHFVYIFPSCWTTIVTYYDECLQIIKLRNKKKTSIILL
jgi:hypothetical protein